MTPLVPGYPPQQPMQGGPGPHHPGMMPPMPPGSNGSFASGVGQRMGNPPGMNVPGNNGGPGPHMNPMMANAMPQNPMTQNSMAQVRIAPGPANMLIDAYPQYRQQITNHHKTNLPPNAMNSMMQPGNAASPAAAADSPFSNPGDGPQSRPGTSQYGGPVPGNRPGQPNKSMAMMPPPSPGMNAAKNPVKLEGTDANIGMPGVHSSPRNQPATTGQGQQPPQSSGPSQPPSMSNTAPPTPSPAAAGMTAPSPSAILNNNNNSQGGNPGQQGPASNQPSGSTSTSGPSSATATDNFLMPEFMQQFNMNAPGFESPFDATLFQPDPMGGGSDFDRDFGEWFNPDTV